MTRSSLSQTCPPCSKRRNVLAILIAGVAVGFVYLDCDPTPAGTRVHADDFSDDLYPPAPALPMAAGTYNPDGTVAQQTPDHLCGRWAMMLNVMLLEKGVESFSQVSDYSAMLHKQERLGRTLGEVQKVECKLRHEPFSVYMKWHSGDTGRELVYVDGKNDGNMIVHPGGWKGRLTGALALDPNGSMATSESRHPCTQAGLKQLAETLLSFHRRNLKRGTGWTCDAFDHQKLKGRDCYLFVITYESPKICKVYRKSMHYIDKELGMPICSKNFGWASDNIDTETLDPAALDEATLIEFYAWSNIQIERRLADGDFDTANADYNFRRR